MSKEDAIAILESQGWIINNPDDIIVDEVREDTIFLHQEGNGEWVVTKGGSVTFSEYETTE